LRGKELIDSNFLSFIFARSGSSIIPRDGVEQAYIIAEKVENQVGQLLAGLIIMFSAGRSKKKRKNEAINL
jgi:hypothetical protein